MKWVMFIFLALLAAPVFAQTAGQVAVIDVQKVVQSSEVGKKALGEIKAIKDKKQADIDQRQNNIQSMQEKLDKQKDILSADAQDKLRGDIEKGITDLKRFREDSEADIQNRLNEALEGMEKRVLPIIQKIGNERAYSLIISKDQLIYYNTKNDITDEVIKQFNEEANKGAAETPKQ
jgi:outer membrane protein